ncbi:hypothetical protein SBC1_79810 (plasmid) [Caballeronia sp. SBC1]|uniref:DUF3830 family protein n=1 Tax=Caballeronia sp. SBC1 TaxID=2705548 RepID=UPI00140E4A95|nr:DUF3830 family protein [Caballeronia sp. SBC1]QIN67934.1 hypothetical protein SBC1_79810 [Caballeronia sp. SBC1]
MTERTLLLTEAASGLSAHFTLASEQAPENTAFLWDFLSEPREMAAIHAMWTGPEISCPIPSNMLVPEQIARVLPPENATLTPQPGDLVLAYVPARMWGGNPAPIFDLGVFYGPGARMLFPIGWLAGSVVGKVPPQELAGLAQACGAIRKSGSCVLCLERA